MELSKADKKYLMRDEAAKNLEIVHSEGNFLIDANGKKYIDFFMGWCVGNVGWSNEEIKNRIKNFHGPEYVCPAFYYQPWAELAELLAKITPGKLTKSFRATGGTEAVEFALRAANIYTKRNKFISLEGSYHGDSIAALSVGSSNFKKQQPKLLFNFYKIKPPLNKKTADQVEQYLKKKDVAALIMEPISCNLDVLIPEPEFMSRIQKLCKQYGTLLIMDEVATGFGRTGKLFATEYYDIEPDIMCLAKAITGGYGAMGATIVTEEVAKKIEYKSSFYSTYGWYPLSVAAAIANIQYILQHKKFIEENTQAMSQYFYQRLSAMKFKYPAEIRIKGLAIAVRFKNLNYASEINQRAQENGLLLSPFSDKSFCMFPALNIDKTIAEKGLDILEKCL